MSHSHLRIALLTFLCAIAPASYGAAQADAGVATPDTGRADTGATAHRDDAGHRDRGRDAPTPAADAQQPDAGPQAARDEHHEHHHHHDGDQHGETADHHGTGHRDDQHADDATDHHDAEHHADDTAEPDDGHHHHGHHHHHHHHHGGGDEATEATSTEQTGAAPRTGGAAADLAHPATPPPSTPATPTPTATGTPSAAPVTAVVAGVAIRLTGIAHASVYASQGVQSFGNATSVAPTSALNPALLGSQADDAQLSFQVQQSRFGLMIGEGSPFRGIVEIDFVHFDQSSPTAQAFPRIRIMQLEWRFDDHNRLFVGQGWDIFGNAIGPQLLSHSSNLVGTMFQAGNIGFMRHQLGWEGRFGDVAVALALGMQGSNTGPTFNDLEESATPTGAARVMYYLNSASVIGISGIGTASRFTNGAAEERRLALGGELFADMTFGPVIIHAEAYIAQNLANTGALNLGQGRFGHDVADAGGYLSGRLNLGEWSITAMYGFAGVLRPSEVVPGYTSANAAWNTLVNANQPPGSLAAVGASNANAGPGMAWNTSGHVGVWFSPMQGLSFVLEPYFYYTRFVMDGSRQLDPTDPSHMRVQFGSTTDAARYGAQADRFAAGAQFVTMFQF